jgi:hypothetical protein
MCYTKENGGKQNNTREALLRAAAFASCICLHVIVKRSSDSLVSSVQRLRILYDAGLIRRFSPRAYSSSTGSSGEHEG